MSKILSKVLVASFFFLLILGRNDSALLHNATSLALVQAITNPSLNYEIRVIFFKQVIQWSRSVPDEWGKEFSNVAEQEKENILLARKYLNSTEEFKHLEPGRQLLINPEFDFGIEGWIQYKSFSSVSYEEKKDQRDAVIETTRTGDGHDALVQILYLKPTKCYLFLVEGLTIRRDDTPNYWLYLESYKNGLIPTGQSLIRNQGTQSRQQYADVFCVPESNNKLEKIGIAPFNAYGNVTISLNSARLYELNY